MSVASSAVSPGGAASAIPSGYVLKAARRDQAQGKMLKEWIESRVLPAFDGRILPVDTAVARMCAGLHVPDRRAERDALIGATALAHRLTMATRNTKNFAPMGVALVNPWT